MFNLYEMIKKKPSDQVFFFNDNGMVISGSLMILGIYNDINEYFKQLKRE